MNLRMHYDEEMQLPRMFCDTEYENILAAFISSDIGVSDKRIKLMLKMLSNVKSGKRKSEGYVGGICSAYISKKQVKIEDNNMLYEEDQEFVLSLKDFESILLKWQKFLFDKNCLKDT